MMSLSDVLRDTEKPIISINEDGVITLINSRFTDAYGWTEADVLALPVTTIIPPEMRQAHQAGFSRFVTTENPTLLGKPLRLPILTKDGRTLSAEHFIVGEKQDDGHWRFAATIVCVDVQ